MRHGIFLYNVLISLGVKPADAAKAVADIVNSDNRAPKDDFSDLVIEADSAKREAKRKWLMNISMFLAFLAFAASIILLTITILKVTPNFG